MDKKDIKELKVGDAVQQFFLIKTVECKVSTNNKKYLDITFVDKTGDINAKLWDASSQDEERYVNHALVKVRGVAHEWQGRMQLKLENIRLAVTEDGVDVADFVPSAPRTASDMYQEVTTYIERIEHSDLKQIVCHIINNKKSKLMIYPAAKQNHHSVRSGLLYHILTMLQLGERVSEVYTTLNRDLLFAGIILHDMAKLDEMDAGDLGIVSNYTVEGELLGHIIQGIKLIDRAAKAVGADEEVSLLLQHMILSHHAEPEFGSPKRPMIPEAEILHYLDTIDARMYDMRKVLDNTKAGVLSDKVWLLNNRKLYKAECTSTK
ncbi:MAG: HD domain-containing protein [Pelosinus sp.]|nr:HD domain-containing protein [Pelosinus sp.]